MLVHGNFAQVYILYFACTIIGNYLLQEVSHENYQGQKLALIDRSSLKDVSGRVGLKFLFRRHLVIDVKLFRKIKQKKYEFLLKIGMLLLICSATC